MNSTYLEPANWKRFFLTVLRLSVGWHFFFEGISKILSEGWSATNYLAGSTGFLSGFYHALASSPIIMEVVDFMNMYGLLLIGLGLFLGVAIRIAAIAGTLLLMLYYFAYPPFGATAVIQGDGSLYIVNKNLIEAAVLVLFVFLHDKGYGIDRLIANLRNKRTGTVASQGRREAFKDLATLPLLGLMGIGGIHNKQKYGFDGLSGATVQLKKADIKDLKGELPKGKLGNLEVSRLYMGSNLINGITHSRDLYWARQLVKQYNTERKLFETYSLAEQAGINMTNMGLPVYKVFEKYKKITGSKMMACVQALVNEKEQKDSYFKYSDRLSDFKASMEHGAETMYVHGTSGDSLCEKGRLDLIQEAVEYVQSQGRPCGIGAHSIQVIIACEKAGLKPDYYYKTMHHDNYWSAHPREFREEFKVTGDNSNDHNHYHDNMWDIYPEQTVEVISNVKVPLIGFKVLAAGAIQPADGFRYAFENGADFICVGMFDYQIVEDVNLVTEILNGSLNRSRPWYS